MLLYRRPLYFIKGHLIYGPVLGSAAPALVVDLRRGDTPVSEGGKSKTKIFVDLETKRRKTAGMIYTSY